MPFRRRIWMFVLIGGVVVALVAAGAMVAMGSPAQAATPRCNTTETVYTGVVSNAHIWMPSSTPNWTIDCYMEYGDAGPEVWVLQSTLNHCYGKSLAVDGQFGSRTRAALTEAQRSHGRTSGLGRYSGRDAYSLRFWGFSGFYYVCARIDGPMYD